MTTPADELMQLLDRRLARRQREHTRAWKRYKEFWDYHDPGVAAKFKETAGVAAARVDEVRITINALKRLRRV